MKKLINKLQNELLHLQESVQKESSEILAKLKKIDLKENIESKRKELEKLIEKKYKTFLPTANRFAKELRDIANKAGIDINKWEKNLWETTGMVKKNLEKNKAKLAQGKAKLAQGKGQIAKKIKQMATEKPRKKVVTKKKTPAKKTTTKTTKAPRTSASRSAGQARKES